MLSSHWSKLLLILLFSLVTTADAKLSIGNGRIKEGAHLRWPHKSERGQLRIFWWNIANEKFSKKAIEKLKLTKAPFWSKQGAVRGNLLRHIDWYAPDMIILGEVAESKRTELETTFAEYLHSEFLPYHPGSKNGLLTLSMQPMTEIFQAPVNISPGPNTSKTKYSPMVLKANVDYWKTRSIKDRLMEVYEVYTPAGEFYVSPVHFVNPWPTYTGLYTKSSWPGARLKAKMRVAVKQMLLSEDLYSKKYSRLLINPLHNQHVNFRDNISDYGIDKLPLIMIGDFNSPSRIMPYGYPTMVDKRLTLPDLGHRILAMEYQAPFERMKNYHTIPTELAGKGKPKVRIDKVFLTKSLKSKTIWIFKYSGSDHYPIQIDVDL